MIRVDAAAVEHAYRDWLLRPQWSEFRTPDDRIGFWRQPLPDVQGRVTAVNVIRDSKIINLAFHLVGDTVNIDEHVYPGESVSFTWEADFWERPG